MKGVYYQTKFIEDLQWNAVDATLQLQNGIPKDFPLKGLWLELRARIHVAGAGVAGAILPEAPYTLFQRIRVSGVHAKRGSEVIFDMPGSSLHEYNTFYIGQYPIFYNPDALAGAVGDYDIIFQLYVPFALSRVHPMHEAQTLLDAQRYDNLQLELVMGSDDDVFNAVHTFTDTFVGFENVGNPVIRVSRDVAHFGRDIKFAPALVKRTTKDVDANLALTDQYLTDLNVGNAIRSVMVKQYLRAAAPQSPNAGTLPTWSDLFMTRCAIKVNDVAIRDLHFTMLRGISCYAFHSIQTEAQRVCNPYGVFEFVDRGDMNSALVTYDYKARGKRLEFHATTTAALTQRVELTQTEIIPAAG